MCSHTTDKAMSACSHYIHNVCEDGLPAVSDKEGVKPYAPERDYENLPREHVCIMRVLHYAWRRGVKGKFFGRKDSFG